jgi:RNA polymerase sigma-70 factor (ECF subfamily)
VLNESQFTQFYRLTSKQLAVYLHRVSGDKNLAEDLLQESYVRLLRSAPDSLTDGQLRSYLYQTATRAYYDSQRKQRSWTRLFTGRSWSWRKSGEEAEYQEVPGTGDPARSWQTNIDFARAFERLAPRERSLLWLAYVERYEHGEIASILGLSAKSVKVLLFRARNELRSILVEMGIRSFGEI